MTRGSVEDAHTSKTVPIKVFLRLKPSENEAQNHPNSPKYVVIDRSSLSVSCPSTRKASNQRPSSSQGSSSNYVIDLNTTAIPIKEKRMFKFDGVFGPNATQDEVFLETAAKMVPYAFRGYNACCFAYGQTGSGKTYTISGPDGGDITGAPPSSWGFIPRIASAIFSEMAAREPYFEITLSASLMELYCDNLRDLGKATLNNVAIAFDMAISQGATVLSGSQRPRSGGSALDSHGQSGRPSSSHGRDRDIVPGVSEDDLIRMRTSPRPTSATSMFIDRNTLTPHAIGSPRSPQAASRAGSARPGSARPDSATPSTLSTMRTSDLHSQAIADRKGTMGASDPNGLPRRYAAESLEIREDGKGRVVVPGLTKIPMENLLDVLSLLERSHTLRATHEHRANKTSSRSHTIFTFYIVQTDRTTGHATTSQLHFVDLAGSERVDKSEAKGQRLIEAQSINTSLAALGNVVTRLQTAHSQGQQNSFIPYRDSKLTRLLQGSLGGDCITSVIATIVPTAEDFDECLSTLQFASRCRSVQNAPKMNILAPGPESVVSRIQQLEAEVNVLRYKMVHHRLADALRLMKTLADVGIEGRLLSDGRVKTGNRTVGITDEAASAHPYVQKCLSLLVPAPSDDDVAIFAELEKAREEIRETIERNNQSAELFWRSKNPNAHSNRQNIPLLSARNQETLMPTMQSLLSDHLKGGMLDPKFLPNPTTFGPLPQSLLQKLYSTSIELVMNTEKGGSLHPQTPGVPASVAFPVSANPVDSHAITAYPERRKSQSEWISGQASSSDMKFTTPSFGANPASEVIASLYADAGPKKGSENGNDKPSGSKQAASGKAKKASGQSVSIIEPDSSKKGGSQLADSLEVDYSVLPYQYDPENVNAKEVLPLAIREICRLRARIGDMKGEMEAVRREEIRAKERIRQYAKEMEDVKLRAAMDVSAAHRTVKDALTQQAEFHEQQVSTLMREASQPSREGSTVMVDFDDKEESFNKDERSLGITPFNSIINQSITSGSLLTVPRPFSASVRRSRVSSAASSRPTSAYRFPEPTTVEAIKMEYDATLERSRKSYSDALTRATLEAKRVMGSATAKAEQAIMQAGEEKNKAREGIEIMKGVVTALKDRIEESNIETMSRDMKQTLSRIGSAAPKESLSSARSQHRPASAFSTTTRRSNRRSSLTVQDVSNKTSPVSPRPSSAFSGLGERNFKDADDNRVKQIYENELDLWERTANEYHTTREKGMNRPSTAPNSRNAQSERNSSARKARLTETHEVQSGSVQNSSELTLFSKIATGDNPYGIHDRKQSANTSQQPNTSPPEAVSKFSSIPASAPVPGTSAAQSTDPSTLRNRNMQLPLSARRAPVPSAAPVLQLNPNMFRGVGTTAPAVGRTSYSSYSAK